MLSHSHERAPHAYCIAINQFKACMSVGNVVCHGTNCDFISSSEGVTPVKIHYQLMELYRAHVVTDAGVDMVQRYQ